MGRMSRGRIFLRGGKYYGQWYINGKEYKRKLLDDDGNDIPRKYPAGDAPHDENGQRLSPAEAAKRVLRQMLAPLRMATMAARARAFAAEADRIENRIADLENKRRNKCARIDDFWTLYARFFCPEYITAQPKGRTRLYVYFRYVEDFKIFCRGVGADTIADVDENIAAA